MKASQVLLNFRMDGGFDIHTPLMRIDNAATWQRTRALGDRVYWRRSD